MREIELKFELSETDAARLAKSNPFGKDVKPRSRHLHAIYFDTADHRLAAHGMALRLRDEDGQWVQCLKAGHSGEAGLHARDEWEFPRRDASLDLKAMRDTPLASALGGARAKLAPAFEVEMERLTWQIATGSDARVEIALDRGHVRRGRKRAPVCEVEIESIEGEPLAVFEVAERLLAQVRLRVSSVTKAQRGYALSARVRAKPVKAAGVVLAEGTSVDAAARSIVAAALAQLQGNEALAGAQGADDEYLHQFRVGLRRLRAALRIFPDVLGPDEAERIRRDCRWLSRKTGEARDWDVFTEATLPALLAGAAAQRRAATMRAMKARDAARKRVREAIESPRYTRFALRFAHWLASVHSHTDEDVRPLARKALQRQHHRSMRALRGIASIKAAARHRVRIRLKRLRYACESLASLFGRERGDPYVKALAKLQDDLGGAVDARVAMALVKTLRLPVGQAAAALARLRAEEAQSLPQVEAHVAALRAADPFWGGKAR